MSVSRKSIQNLIAGKNKKKGGSRTTMMISGIGKALAERLGDGNKTAGFETAIRKNSTLADKAYLISSGKWGMPQLDEFGLMADSGWEDINYEPSSFVLRGVSSVGEFFERATVADAADPFNLQALIEAFGIDAVCEVAKGYSLDGWPRHA